MRAAGVRAHRRPLARRPRAHVAIASASIAVRAAGAAAAGRAAVEVAAVGGERRSASARRAACRTGKRARLAAAILQYTYRSPEPYPAKVCSRVVQNGEPSARESAQVSLEQLTGDASANDQCVDGVAPPPLDRRMRRVAKLDL